MPQAVINVPEAPPVYDPSLLVSITLDGELAAPVGFALNVPQAAGAAFELPALWGFAPQTPQPGAVRPRSSFRMAAPGTPAKNYAARCEFHES